MSRFSALAFGGVLLLASAVPIRAQCPEPATDPGGFSKVASPSAREQMLPEDGNLSDTTYTSRYFGFALDLPLNAQGHMIMLPLMPERQHALLAIGYQNGGRSGSLTIDAIEPAENVAGFAAEAEQQRYEASASIATPPATMPSGTVQPGAEPGTLQPPTVQPGADGRVPPGPVSSQVGPKVQLALPGYKPLPHFQSSMRNKEGTHTALYWTRIKNYKIGVLVSTNDKEFLQKAKQAMSAAHFYCLQDDGTLTLPDGRLVKPEGGPYQGPTIPTWRADTAIKNKPALQVPPGEVKAGVYRNPALGVEYEVPKGWNVLPANNSGDPPADLTALRVFDFLHACERTLLRIAPPAEGNVASQGRRPAITLRALDPVCLSLRTPALPSDKRTAEEVGATLEMLSEFGQITSSDLLPVSGQLFMVFHGTIVARATVENLAQRMAQVLYVTRHNKMLLVWSMMAPTSAELNALPMIGVTFDGSPRIELRPALNAKK